MEEVTDLVPETITESDNLALVVVVSATVAVIAVLAAKGARRVWDRLKANKANKDIEIAETGTTEVEA